MIRKLLDKTIIFTILSILILTFVFQNNSVGGTSLFDVEKRQQEADILEIYNEVKTPYDFNVVLSPTGKEGDFDSDLVDCPVVFKYDNSWYMSYLGHDGTGYRTGLAKSNDLVNWERLGMILDVSDPDENDSKLFDTYNAGGYIALEQEWGKPPVPLKHEGKYVMSYLASNEPGYEKGEIVAMIAFAENIEGPWEKYPIPILKPGEFSYEADKIWRTQILKHEDIYYIYYNTGVGPEVAAMATSTDLLSWKKYEENPVLKGQFNTYDYGYQFHCDAQVIAIKDKWVMFFFTDAYDEGILDSFAISDNLYEWKDSYTMLRNTEQQWNSKCAHKPMVFKYNDTVFHFYCAVSETQRTIALATNNSDFENSYKEISKLQDEETLGEIDETGKGNILRNLIYFLLPILFAGLTIISYLFVKKLLLKRQG